MVMMVAVPTAGDGVDDLAALDDFDGHQAPLADARLARTLWQPSLLP